MTGHRGAAEDSFCYSSRLATGATAVAGCREAQSVQLGVALSSASIFSNSAHFGQAFELTVS